MYALTVIGLDVVLASVKPITVVCVAEAAVTRTTGVVPTFFATYRVNVLVAIWVPYPNAIAIATAVPAGSTCKFVCAPLTVVAPVPPCAIVTGSEITEDFDAIT